MCKEHKLDNQEHGANKRTKSKQVRVSQSLGDMQRRRQQNDEELDSQRAQSMIRANQQQDSQPAVTWFCWADENHENRLEQVMTAKTMMLMLMIMMPPHIPLIMLLICRCTKRRTLFSWHYWMPSGRTSAPTAPRTSTLSSETPPPIPCMS